MTIGLCDKFSTVWPKLRWVQEAAQRLGWRVLKMPEAKDIESQADAVDFILFGQECMVTLKQLRRLRRIFQQPWVAWIFDLIGHGLREDLRAGYPWEPLDLVFCKTPGQIPTGKGIWMDQGCPVWQSPAPPHDKRKYDVLIVGTRTAQRRNLCELCVAAGLKTVFAGGGPERPWNLPGLCDLGWVTGSAGIEQLFGCALCVIGDNRVVVPGYWSDRVWLSLSRGTPYVGEFGSGPEQLQGCLWWNRPETAVALCREIIEDQERWERLHNTALAAAAENTYDARLLVIAKAIQQRFPDGTHRPPFAESNG